MQHQRLTVREELILLAILALHPDAYAYSIKKHIYQLAGDRISLGTIHTILYKLENRGLLQSHMGGRSTKRGGRSKRLFELTLHGTKIMQQVHIMRSNMRSQISPDKFSLG